MIQINHKSFQVFWSAAWAHNKRAQLKKAANDFQKQNADCFISISHTTAGGGFATSTHYPVGYDIELANRVITERAFARVSTHAERKAIEKFDQPPLALWVAKEAAWKALKGSQQPKTITGIELLGFHKAGLSGHLGFEFKLSNTKELATIGYGRVWQQGRFIMSLATRESNFS